MIEGGPSLDTLPGLSNIQVFAQDSELGRQYKNAKGDLVFQGADKFFQGTDFSYLLGR